MSDMDGRVGSVNGGMEIYMKRYVETTKNDNKNRLKKLCIANNVIVINTKFIYKDFCKYSKEEIELEI